MPLDGRVQQSYSAYIVCSFESNLPLATGRRNVKDVFVRDVTVKSSNVPNSLHTETYKGFRTIPSWNYERDSE